MLSQKWGDAVARKIVSEEFNAEFYIRQLESSENIVDPVAHYFEYGWRQHLDPSPNFSTSYYLEENPDVRDSGINPFFHFIGWGRAEGRRGTHANSQLYP